MLTKGFFIKKKLKINKNIHHADSLLPCNIADLILLL